MIGPLIVVNKYQGTLKGAIKIGQSRETGNMGTQDKEKQNKNTTQYVFDTTTRK